MTREPKENNRHDFTKASLKGFRVQTVLFLGKFTRMENQPRVEQAVQTSVLNTIVMCVASPF